LSWTSLDRQLGEGLGVREANGVIRRIISIILIIDLAEVLAVAAGSR
jgi:hypothetical protein